MKTLLTIAGIVAAIILLAIVALFIGFSIAVHDEIEQYNSESDHW